MNPARKISLGLFALDLLAIFAVFNALSWIRGISADQGLLLTTLLVPALLLWAALYLVDGYQARTDMMSLDYASEHSIAIIAAMLTTLLITYAFIYRDFPLQTSRGVIALSYLALIPVTLAYRRAIYGRLTGKHQSRSLIFVGEQASCRGFQDECRRHHLVQPVVLCTPTGTVAPWPAPDAPFRSLTQLLGPGGLPGPQIEAIILSESGRELPAGDSERLVELYFSGVPTYTLELFQQVYWRKIPLDRLNQTWLFQEGFQIAREPVFERIKRLSDIAFAVIGLTLSSPLLLLAACAIKLGGRGPVFFAQTRIGRNRVPFTLHKLRTMRPGSDQGDPYTRADDARVTPLGRFLRASRLDEFPQLWNVLRGDMSLIGPRAEWDKLVTGYEREIPCYHFRHLVRPGITGWAQVNYPYGANKDDTLRKLEYDLYYIRHFSFHLDAAIILKTVHIMFFGKGR